MAQRRSKDYIPSYGDFIRKQDEMSEFIKKNGNPYNTYLIKYEMYGQIHEEEQSGLSQADAVESISHSWAINGVYIKVLSATLIKKSERTLMQEAAALKEAAEQSEKDESETKTESN